MTRWRNPWLSLPRCSFDDDFALAALPEAMGFFVRIAGDARQDHKRREGVPCALPARHLHQRGESLLSQPFKKARITLPREHHQRSRRLVPVCPHWRLQKLDKWLRRDPSRRRARAW